MKQDKIVIEEGWFVQIVVSFLMTCAYFQEFLHAIWSLPLMAILVIVVNCYFNAIVIGYKLKSKTLQLKWVFIPPFIFNNFKTLIYEVRITLFDGNKINRDKPICNTANNQQWKNNTTK